MATLTKKPLPGPWNDKDYDDKNMDWDAHMKAEGEAFDALQAKSDALPEGEIVGAMLSFSVGDGSAVYVVTTWTDDETLVLASTAGVQNAVAFSARSGLLRLTLPMPSAAETWRVYLASKSDVYKKKLVLYGLTGETPNHPVDVVTWIAAGDASVTMDGVVVTY